MPHDGIKQRRRIERTGWLGQDDGRPDLSLHWLEPVAALVIDSEARSIPVTDRSGPLYIIRLPGGGPLKIVWN
jgi:hypothetical protein